jgi:hypothetical protein
MLKKSRISRPRRTGALPKAKRRNDASLDRFQQMSGQSGVKVARKVRKPVEVWPWGDK